MKACSFLPAATEIIKSLSLEKDLVGITFECASDKPKVVRSHLEGNHLTSDEIDKIVAQSQVAGNSLYYIDEPLLAQLAPDVIFTQDVCEVCQISTAQVTRAVHKLPNPPKLVPLLPKTLADVFENVRTIAGALGHAEGGEILLQRLAGRMAVVAARLAGRPVRKVLLLEWISPLYNCGHWIPDQIIAAGGIDEMANPAGYSVKMDAAQLRAYDPEVIVIAPCGFSIARAKEEAHLMQKMPHWGSLQAVQNGEVYFANADLFTCPGTGLITGIETLAALFHPTVFPDFRGSHQTHFSQMLPARAQA
jgi:iron complex transport system substrate-binding protein